MPLRYMEVNVKQRIESVSLGQRNREAGELGPVFFLRNLAELAGPLTCTLLNR